MLSTASFTLRHPRLGLGTTTVGVVLCAAVALAGRTATAQSTTALTQPSNTQEYGIDAGAVIGLGSSSSVALTLPAARARIGFFLNPDTRWSIEPAAGLSYTKISGLDNVFTYNLELGALYHFAPPAEVYAATGRRAVAYVRPFVNFTGTRAGSNSNHEFSLGGGLGIKVPWRPDVAFRFEGNLGYGFTNKAARLGVFAGLSFFTRNLIAVPGT